jgi:hypothetical protein
MLKLLGAIAVLVAVAAGCGSNDPEPSAGPSATPAPPIPEHVRAAHRFQKGHSAGVRAYYGAGEDTYAPGAGDVEAEYHQPPRPATGGIGDAITLTGTNIGVRMRVTVLSVEDPVHTSRPARAGKRFVAVRLRMRSTGIAILEGELRNAVVDYGRGRQAPVVLGVKATCSRGFEAGIRVEVGNSATGCVLFEVPVGKRPRQLQLALEVVPAEAGGRWSLR